MRVIFIPSSKTALFTDRVTAHDIRNRSTKQFKLVAGLTAQHRWCLTGTPIQNSLEDLGALVAFLRVPVLENPATFRKFIVNQSTSTSASRFKHLRLLLESICLRRTRESIGLNDPVAEVRKINLTPEERNEYTQIIHSCRMKIESAVSRKGKGTNTALLESLLRLRLFCNNGMPHPGTSKSTSVFDRILSYLQQVDQAICAYCATTIYSIDTASDTDGGTLMSKCYHLACRECLSRYEIEKKRCPECLAGNKDADINETVRRFREPKPLNEHDPHSRVCSSKLKALMDDLWSNAGRKRCVSQSKNLDGRLIVFSIVFSSWKTTLDLVGRFLKDRGARPLYIHGSVSLKERKRILKDFRSPTGPDVLLMTLGTGAVG